MNNFTMLSADEGKKWIDRYREINRVFLLGNLLTPQERMALA